MNALQNVKFVSVTPPAAIVDNAAYTTAEIDTSGFDYLTVVAYLGATDIAMSALKLTESDTSGSGHADISGADFSSGTDIDGSAAALPAADDDNKFFAFQVDLRGRKRYIDVSATAGDGAAGTFCSILAVLSRAGEAPNTVSEAGCGGLIRI